jgi:hypothetical protein
MQVRSAKLSSVFLNIRWCEQMGDLMDDGEVVPPFARE